MKPVITISPEAFDELSSEVGYVLWDTTDLRNIFVPVCENGDGSRVRMHLDLGPVMIASN